MSASVCKDVCRVSLHVAGRIAITYNIISYSDYVGQIKIRRAYIILKGVGLYYSDLLSYMLAKISTENVQFRFVSDNHKIAFKRIKIYCNSFLSLFYERY